ncbi:6-carboxytetrahydropterin synthase QueD [Thiorhodospira sibirica]|uniref:6-carboxytetrahydropterin synthase QueD n=1 Tax=Thiorhodospira sibirica TaxID=154347 RepID=UPI00022C589D|nr:6-carboxytetrahydropterin synthase QueD [Thiorhodospira sibirica]
MPATYVLKVCVDFSAAHVLNGYDGGCAHLHGHNWQVEVEVKATALDDLGMGLDFKVIKQAAREVVAMLDHRYLNDLAAFSQQNPTAENIAAWIFGELATRLNRPHVRMHAVTLWETPRACVRYSET